MQNEVSMKILLLITSILCASMASASIQDVPYQFDQEKIAASDDSFHFLRSFVDYYYNLVAANKDKLNITKVSSFSGWCVGDAHPENFGVLLQNNSSALFTMNDMDDFGPCPVAYDVLRLFVSSRLYLPSIDLNALYQSYQQGLLSGKVIVPASIQAMIQAAQQTGTQVEAKKLNGNMFKRKSSMTEVTANEKKSIMDEVESLFKAESLKVLDIVATSKVGGGSGGLSRYEVLCKTGKQFLHLELKTLVAPGIQVIATGAIPPQAERMKDALIVEQGQNYSHYYDVLNITGNTMLLRPKFAGNIGVDLTQASTTENTNIILFEAYVLGRIHAESVQAGSYLASLRNFSVAQLESDVNALTTLFNTKFTSLKN
jgi:hypothetical protein